MNTRYSLRGPSSHDLRPSFAAAELALALFFSAAHADAPAPVPPSAAALSARILRSRASLTSAIDARPVTASLFPAQKSYAAYAARASHGTDVNAYTYPNPTASYARLNTSMPVMTSPSGVTPCIVDIAVSKSIPRFAAGSYAELAMSTRSSRPRPASFARRKFTSRTHSGQSPSYRTRTSHVAADASHGGICREGVVVDVDVDVDDDDDDARARSALGGGGARTRGR